MGTLVAPPNDPADNSQTMTIPNATILITVEKHGELDKSPPYPLRRWYRSARTHPLKNAKQAVFPSAKMFALTVPNKTKFFK